MKNKMVLFLCIALVLGFVGGYTVTRLNKNSPSPNTELLAGAGNGNRNGGGKGTRTGTNRNNCLADDCLMVDNLEYPAGELSEKAKNALTKAIEDEYKAYTTYQGIIEKFGMVRPFSMIIRSEESHIASLKSLFDKYGIPIPVNSWANKIVLPVTLQLACQIGVDAEIANANLYRTDLLPAVSEYEDVTDVFTNLMNASEQKHLQAFERCN